MSVSILRFVSEHPTTLFDMPSSPSSEDSLERNCVPVDTQTLPVSTLGRQSLQKPPSSIYSSPVPAPTDIQTLPVELLLIIFQELIDGKRDSAVCFIMAGVCKYWKNIVRNFSSLWTTIRVPDFSLDMNDNDIKREVSKLSLALSLSSRLPLRIKHSKPGCIYEANINNREEDGLPTDAVPEQKQRADSYAAQMMTALFSKHDTWRKMQIIFDHPLFLHFNQTREQFKNASETLNGIGKNLRSLQVILSGADWERKSFDDFCSWIREPEALDCLFIQDETSNFMLEDNTMEQDLLPSISTIAFCRKRIKLVDCVKVLSFCRNSDEVWLFGRDPNDENIRSYPIDNESESDRTEMSQIANADRTKLDIKMIRLCVIQFPFDLLNRFTMPNLTAIIITLQFDGCVKDIEKLAEFLDRSQCRLNRFVVRDEDLKERDVLPFLRMAALKKIPEVEFFEVKRGSATRTKRKMTKVDVEESDQSYNPVERMNFKMWHNVDDSFWGAYYHYRWKASFAIHEKVQIVCKDGQIFES